MRPISNKVLHSLKEQTYIQERKGNAVVMVRCKDLRRIINEVLRSRKKVTDND